MSETDALARAGEISRRFSARLRELRLRAGLSQAELGQRIGVPQSRIGEWETCRGRTGGPAYPTWEQVVRLSLILDVPTDTFQREPGRALISPLKRGGRPAKNEKQK